LRLSPAEKIETLVIVAFALVAEVAVRCVGLPILARWLRIDLDDVDDTGLAVPVAAAPRLAPATLARRAAAVDRVYRGWPRGASCLRRALVLGFYVRRARPLLRIGVARDGDEVKAHAWIEVDGHVLGEDTGEFAPLRPPLRRSG
jgi:hypothetical protein